VLTAKQLEACQADFKRVKIEGTSD